MNKLFAFLILLLVGAVMFAVPVASEPGGVSALNEVKIVPQRVGDTLAFTDVAPVIMPADNLCSGVIFMNASFVALFASAWIETTDYLFTETEILMRNTQEVKPYYGYSKTAVPANDVMTDRRV